MRYTPTLVRDCFLLKKDIFHDERGSLWEPFARADLAPEGLDSRVSEVLFVRNYEPLTLRGMHYQQAPMGQAKTVSVLHGSLFDVVADIDPKSPSYGKVQTFILSANTGHSLFVPANCAHGYLSLEEDTRVIYTLSQCRSPANERGLRWDDPFIGEATWPDRPRVISQRDLEWAPFGG